jgi:hypothetical protein
LIGPHVPVEGGGPGGRGGGRANDDDLCGTGAFPLNEPLGFELNDDRGFALNDPRGLALKEFRLFPLNDCRSARKFSSSGA